MKKPKNIEKQIVNKKIRSSYFTTVLSISLVLFLLGTIILLMLNTQRLSNFVKENIGVDVFIKEEVKNSDIQKLKKKIEALAYVKETRYVSADEAAKDFQKDLGEDFIKYIGRNPLLPSIEVRILAENTNAQDIEEIAKNFQKYPEVKEVIYQKDLVNLVNENVRKISAVLLVFAILLFILSITLISNTVRLTVYSKRFIINTMKLVGATNGFIRTPFLQKSMIQGLISSIIAIIMLSFVIIYTEQELKGLIDIQNAEMLIILYFSVMTLGIVITRMSTYFAVNRYLRMNNDQLYY